MSRRSRHALIRCGLLLAILLTTFATPIAAYAAETATVSEQLNLRSGPGLGNRILTVMPAGASVVLLGEATEGWYPVQYNDLSGWAYGQYLSIGGGAPPVTTSGATGSATVVTNLLNMRSGPGIGYSVIAQLSFGSTVELLGDRQTADDLEWVQIMAKAQRGWVAGRYLDPGEGGGASTPPAETAPAPTPSPTPAPAASGGSITEIITEAANRYGQNPAAMLAVARCESGLNPNAYNARSGASGLFQFLPGTWRTTPYASYSIFDAWANANAAAWMWSVGRRGEWVC